jgi:hypothetical protein
MMGRGNLEALSKGLNGVGVFVTLSEGENLFINIVPPSCLEFRTLEEVHEPINSESLIS